MEGEPRAEEQVDVRFARGTGFARGPTVVEGWKRGGRVATVPCQALRGRLFIPWICIFHPPPTIPHELLPRFYDILCRFLLLLTFIHALVSVFSSLYARTCCRGEFAASRRTVCVSSIHPRIDSRVSLHFQCVCVCVRACTLTTVTWPYC